ncbi:uncharacterized protein TRAVEDRAFT_53385 [Trametes versicolor FP-101664 SS1]|uniref:uncharacterized protein n=1 Tax=Trametes versicolor (strain FP-101664) TaxID=717944 RepID=UPI0004623102|nr:uncharacterized protein TRAVEDRAFT_53385 [Trametes versicolor FP-101664 SS1]EIW52961.1 hypothetical protein TRAVEDRAFT_53385 [Trametes versicolor FP-101664 SS1]
MDDRTAPENSPTPPPPPLTQPRRVFDMATRTVPPADKKRTKTVGRATTANGRGGDGQEYEDDVFSAPRQVQSEGRPRRMLSELQPFTIRGGPSTVADEEEDSEDEERGPGDSTPTPWERRRPSTSSSEKLVQDLEDLAAAEQEHEDDPYEVRNNSMCKDEAYATGITSWEDIVSESTPQKEDAEGLNDMGILDRLSKEGPPSPQKTRPNKRLRVHYSPEERVNEGASAMQAGPGATGMEGVAASNASANVPPPPPYLAQLPPQQPTHYHQAPLPQQQQMMPQAPLMPRVNQQAEHNQQQQIPQQQAEQQVQLHQQQPHPQQQQLPQPQGQHPNQTTKVAITINQVKAKLLALAEELAEKAGISVEVAWGVILDQQKAAAEPTARAAGQELRPQLNRALQGEPSRRPLRVEGEQALGQPPHPIPSAAKAEERPAQAERARASHTEARPGSSGTVHHAVGAGEAALDQRTQDPRTRLQAGEAAAIARHRLPSEVRSEDAGDEMEVDLVGSLRRGSEDPMGTCSVAGLPGHIPVEVLEAVWRNRMDVRMKDEEEEERVRREDEKEGYRRALRELGALTEPQEGWPAIHTRGAYDRVHHLQSAAYEEWLAADDDGKMLIEMARPGDLDNDTVARFAAKLEHVLQGTFGHSEYTLAVPPPRRIAAENEDSDEKNNDYSTVFLVSGAPPLAVEVFVELYAICTEEVAFWAFKGDMEVPKYVGALDGFMQNGENAAANVIKKHLKKETLFTSILNLVKENPRLSHMHGMTATLHIIGTVAVKLVRKDRSDGGSPLIAHLYIDQPTDNGLKWDEWHQSLLKFPLPEASGRPLTLRGPVRCAECHGVDHVEDECRYRNITEWRKRTESIERRMVEKKLKAKARAEAAAAKAQGGVRHQDNRRLGGGQYGPSGPPRRNQIDNRWNRGEGPPFGTQFQGNWNQGGPPRAMSGQGGQGMGAGQATRPPRR